MLDHIGAPDFPVYAREEGERLVEIAGRLCYKSFSVDLNPNIVKVRTDEREYIENILKQHHGSVLEHATVSFALIGVSRILTHELVRHRAGTAFSQESGRFVRLDSFELYRPDAIGEVLEELGETDPGAIALAYEDLENMVLLYERHFQNYIDKLPWDRMNFNQKKRVTSAMRRYSLAGTVNNIVVTANHRAWRHMIEMRTSPGAEEEIVKVFSVIAAHLKHEYPMIYQDMTQEGTHWKFEHSKV
jgi:thymidylate synthase (FAD)